jgi:CRISPR system Cascade subunit CasB
MAVTTSDSTRSRFSRLLACDRNELCERVRPIVLAAKSKGIPLNFETLIADILWWGDRVRTRWAQAYWGGPQAEDASTPAAREAE